MGAAMRVPPGRRRVHRRRIGAGVVRCQGLEGAGQEGHAERDSFSRALHLSLLGDDPLQPHVAARFACPVLRSEFDCHRLRHCPHHCRCMSLEVQCKEAGIAVQRRYGADLCVRSDRTSHPCVRLHVGGLRAASPLDSQRPHNFGGACRGVELAVRPRRHVCLLASLGQRLRERFVVIPSMGRCHHRGPVLRCDEGGRSRRTQGG
mmetsp:Transcript_43669/g.123423  ORF Transcript_43669/g.123423 Transcript_43669/m.123423 type:complete len:205 (+) Transcript_43669:203-817(+)